MNFSDYKLVDGGVVVCEPCFCFTFFSSVALGRHEPPELLGPYRTFIADFGDAVGYCRTDGDQMHATRITPDDLQAWPRWLADPKRRARGGYGVELRTGSSPNEWRAPCLEADHSTVGAPHTFYRISLPLSWLDQAGTAGVTAMLNRMLDGFPLLSGYAGYTFAWDRSSPRVEDVTRPYFLRWLQRHPGILNPTHGSQAYLAPRGLTDLGWITLLGDEYSRRMNGVSGLREALAGVPAVDVEQVNESAIQVRIGNAPRLGDTESGDAMEDYCAVGRVLAPLRNSAELHDDLVVPGIPSKRHPAERLKWIDRFFPQ